MWRIAGGNGRRTDAEEAATLKRPANRNTRRFPTTGEQKRSPKERGLRRHDEKQGDAAADRPSSADNRPTNSRTPSTNTDGNALFCSFRPTTTPQSVTNNPNKPSKPRGQTQQSPTTPNNVGVPPVSTPHKAPRGARAQPEVEHFRTHAGSIRMHPRATPSPHAPFVQAPLGPSVKTASTAAHGNAQPVTHSAWGQRAGWRSTQRSSDTHAVKRLASLYNAR